MRRHLSRTQTPLSAGFSFIELLAYMAIAALLILAAVPQFNAYRAKAQVSNMRSDVAAVASAIEGRYVTDQQYPAPGQVRSDRPALLDVAGDTVRLSDAGTSLTYQPIGSGFALTATNPAAPGVYVNWKSDAGGLQGTMGAAAAAGAPVDGQRNLLVNADFENGEQGLRRNVANGLGSSESSAEAARSGAAGWRIVKNSSSAYVELETVPVQPNRTYTFSAYVRSTNATTMHLTERTDGFRTSIQPVGTTWSRVSWTFTTRADQSIFYGAVGLENRDGGTGAVLDIDDVMLNLGAVPATFTAK